MRNCYATEKAQKLNDIMKRTDKAKQDTQE